MDAPPGPATVLLQRARSGDERAAEEVLGMLYTELRAIAERCMRDQPRGHTLQPTALVHEAWLRLAGTGDGPQGSDRAHFVRLAARAMRHVLVDHARARNADKRGGGNQSQPLDLVLDHFAERNVDPVELSDLLERLSQMDDQLARLVELRWFAGLTIEETARVLEVSTPTVERGWRVARAWLAERLGQ